MASQLFKPAGAGHLYAEIADDPRRDAQASHALADGTAATGLTVKIVADPESLSGWPVMREARTVNHGWS